MTENEAISAIQNDLEWHSKELKPKYKKVLEYAIQALEKVQQFEAIGTIDEFKALKEKVAPKKPIPLDKWGEYHECPVCGKNEGSSMSDLISRSALIKHLTDWRLQECPVGICDEETETYKTICECIEAVEEQPTAYDVGKVVAELARNSRFIDDINEHNIKCISCVIGQKTAIDIVKRGGIE